ncbi:MAG: ice-binding family protein [Balneolaceae bacterium]|nr:ice-binding family protein [Balneolaceae bacterium]
MNSINTYFNNTTLVALLMATVMIGCSNNTTGVEDDDKIDIPIQTIGQSAVNLQTAGNFVILAGSEISNIPTSAITGHIGLSPAAGSMITGFSMVYTTGDQYATSSQVTGKLYASDYGDPTPSNMTTAKGDLTTAYNDAAGRTSDDIVLLSGNLGGLTLTPGLYKSSGSLEISSGDLTFDARGDTSAVFIIQIASTLTTSSDRKVILAGDAKASNIFWQVGTSATLGTTSVMKGTIMADQSIAVNTGASVEGRLLARIAAVTIEGNTIVTPAQ